MAPRGDRARLLVVQGDEAVELRRSYWVCPACEAGLFPPTERRCQERAQRSLRRLRRKEVRAIPGEKIIEPDAPVLPIERAEQACTGA